MQKTLIQLPEIKLVGIICRTNNINEIKLDKAKISKTIRQYLNEEIMNKIQYRSNPGTTYCVYTNYENDFRGDYTFFIGEDVTQFVESASTELIKLVVPAQRYCKITNGPGKMPMVSIEAWEEIWDMTGSDLGGERAYLADLEIYDERCIDPNNAMVDICIGIK